MKRAMGRLKVKANAVAPKIPGNKLGVFKGQGMWNGWRRVKKGRLRTCDQEADAESDHVGPYRSWL